MRRAISILAGVSMLVGLFALPAAADEDETFVDFISEQADERRGQYNIIGQVVLALAEAEILSDGELELLSTEDITAFLPTDFAFRRLAADIEDKRWWQVTESSVIPTLVDALGLEAIADVVKYHIFADGKVDYRTALSLDDNRRNGTEVEIEMVNGEKLGIDRRGPFLQLDDNGNSPFVIRADIDGGNAIVHGISAVLMP